MDAAVQGGVSILLPSRETVACEAGRMRGEADAEQTPHPSPFGRHVLPQGEKEAASCGLDLVAASLPAGLGLSRTSAQRSPPCGRPEAGP